LTIAANPHAQVDFDQLIRQMREMAVRELQRMYLPEQGIFAFRIRKTPTGVQLEGVSRRYTAIALIGLAGESAATAERIFAGRNSGDVCGGLIADAQSTVDLGEAALTLWAARALAHPDAGKALERLRQMGPSGGSYPTVELAWCLTALCVPSQSATDGALADAIAQRLLASFAPRAGLFPHWPVGAARPWFRAHVACFADLVYPVQALSYYHMATGNAEAAEAAGRCGRQMCRLQGRDGQWWWHYDVRTGTVIERYPVYAVHQDGMAPMALHALKKACGEDCSAAIRRGLAWLVRSPEINASLLDAQADVIWRKVARKEPGKLSRNIQVACSRCHPALRMPLVGSLFPPIQVDYESRPYEMGWILHAWPPEVAAAACPSSTSCA
jgi:hypothetical protein